MQHVELRLQSKPYLDQYIWEQILRKTDWITCLRLNHVSIAKQLIPYDEEALTQLTTTVASGDTRLVSRIVKIFDGFLKMDIAAKADRFQMLKVLDGLDKAGSCIFFATRQMAVYAAANSNLAMLDWLFNNRLEVDGRGVLKAAAELGSIVLIIWVMEQAENFRIIDLHDTEAEDALCKALQAGHVDIAIFLIDYFGLQDIACSCAINHASTLTAVQQFLYAYYAHEDSMDWWDPITEAINHGNAEVLSTVLNVMQRIKGTSIPNHVSPASMTGDLSQYIDMAAKRGTVRMLQDLSNQMQDQLDDLCVSDNTMLAAAAKGDLNMVSVLEAHIFGMPIALHASRSWEWSSFYGSHTQSRSSCQDFQRHVEFLNTQVDKGIVKKSLSPCRTARSDTIGLYKQCLQR